MQLEMIHSVVQDSTVIKFKSLENYYRVLEFIDENNIPYKPLTFSSRKDTASILVDEKALQIICKKYGVL